MVLVLVGGPWLSILMVGLPGLPLEICIDVQCLEFFPRALV